MNIKEKLYKAKTHVQINAFEYGLVGAYCVGVGGAVYLYKRYLNGLTEIVDTANREVVDAILEQKVSVNVVTEAAARVLIEAAKK